MQQIENHFRHQAKHRSLNVVTYTNTDTHTSLLINGLWTKNIRKVLTDCFPTISHLQKTVLKPLLKITKKQFGKYFEV